MDAEYTAAGSAYAAVICGCRQLLRLLVPAVALEVVANLFDASYYADTRMPGRMVLPTPTTGSEGALRTQNAHPM